MPVKLGRRKPFSGIKDAVVGAQKENAAPAAEQQQQQQKGQAMQDVVEGQGQGSLLPAHAEQKEGGHLPPQQLISAEGYGNEIDANAPQNELAYAVGTTPPAPGFDEMQQQPGAVVGQEEQVS